MFWIYVPSKFDAREYFGNAVESLEFFDHTIAKERGHDAWWDARETVLKSICASTKTLGPRLWKFQLKDDYSLLAIYLPSAGVDQGQVVSALKSATPPVFSESYNHFLDAVSQSPADTAHLARMFNSTSIAAESSATISIPRGTPPVMTEEPRSRSPRKTMLVPQDPLGFCFGGDTYKEKIKKAAILRWIANPARDMNHASFSAVTADVREVSGCRVMWIGHDFGFMGGSIGAVEGETMTRGLEEAIREQIPVVLSCAGGGLRIQEGAYSLREICKYFVVLYKLNLQGLPVIAVLKDPSFGAITAAYGSSCDVIIALESARVGFSGVRVILNTIFKGDVVEYDANCPQGFQTSQFVYNHGRADVIVDKEISDYLLNLLHVISVGWRLWRNPSRAVIKSTLTNALDNTPKLFEASAQKTPQFEFDISKLRDSSRLQAQDCLNAILDNFNEMHGDSKDSINVCMRGGVGSLAGVPVFIMGTVKGHSLGDMEKNNCGMLSHGDLRFARRLARMAAKWQFPIVILVDSPGAVPNFFEEAKGVYQSMAALLLSLSKCSVPIITVIISEASSGGAACLCYSDYSAILSSGYLGVMTPESVALLRRQSCTTAQANEITTSLGWNAAKLHSLGLVDHIITEIPGDIWGTANEIRRFILKSLLSLADLNGKELLDRRSAKYRRMFPQAIRELKPKEKQELLANLSKSIPPIFSRPVPKIYPAQPYIKYITNTTLGQRKDQWAAMGDSATQVEALELIVPQFNFGASTPRASESVVCPDFTKSDDTSSMKTILDAYGPKAVSQWLLEKGKRQVFVTDTAMRDGQQSLLATRVRTRDLLAICQVMASSPLSKSSSFFSAEMWGGATFESCLEFLSEDPWERLRLIRATLPKTVALQMLIRGENIVASARQSRNVVHQFVKTAAQSGIDVFRIFDCFNDVSRMTEVAKAASACGKIVEMAICFTGDFESEKETIYTLDYYKSVAKQIVAAGAHILAIKDMAGMVKPSHALPLLNALREATNNQLPIHFHTHDSSGLALQTIIAMVQAGCEVVDVCAPQCMSASPSQPSLAALCVALKYMRRAPRQLKIESEWLEPIDDAWKGVVRAPWYSIYNAHNIPSTSAFRFAMPGGQYTNLCDQCKQLGIAHLMPRVLEAYALADEALGRVIKVTPSSRVVGDLAVHMVSRNMTPEQALLSDTARWELPQSVKDMLNGALGVPHHGFPANVLAATQTDPATKRNQVPVDANFEELTAKIQSAYGTSDPVPIESLLACALFPRAYLGKNAEFTKEYGTLTRGLTSRVFFTGMSIGGSTTLHNYSLLAENHCTEGMTPPAADSMPPPGADSLSVTTIQLQRIEPVSLQKTRTLHFLDDSAPVHCVGAANDNSSTSTKEKSESSAPVVCAPGEIRAPISGHIESISVTVGQKVIPGDVLLTLAAMKMSVPLYCPPVPGKLDCSYMVSEVLVKPAQKVSRSLLLVRLTVSC
ncbi:Pyruvate carboxylase [Pelomyxa schiedti]|nr:Pyruvate carboxylase [Pelomyxa schiedti]